MDSLGYRSAGDLFNSGSWGAFAWLDEEVGYGAYLIVENNPPSLPFVGGTLVPLMRRVMAAENQG